MKQRVLSRKRTLGSNPAITNFAILDFYLLICKITDLNPFLCVFRSNTIKVGFHFNLNWKFGTIFCVAI